MCQGGPLGADILVAIIEPLAFIESNKNTITGYIPRWGDN